MAQPSRDFSPTGRGSGVQAVKALFTGNCGVKPPINKVWIILCESGLIICVYIIVMKS